MLILLRRIKAKAPPPSHQALTNPTIPLLPHNTPIYVVLGIKYKSLLLVPLPLLQRTPLNSFFPASYFTSHPILPACYLFLGYIFYDHGVISSVQRFSSTVGLVSITWLPAIIMRCDSFNLIFRRKYLLIFSNYIPMGNVCYGLGWLQICGSWNSLKRSVWKIMINYWNTAILQFYSKSKQVYTVHTGFRSGRRWKTDLTIKL